MNFNDVINIITSYLPWSWCDNCAGVYRVFTIVLILMGIYMYIIHFYQSSFDYLNTSYISIPGYEEYGGWALSHFIVYFIIGLLFPHCDYLAITISIFWEVFETVIGYIFQTDALIPTNEGQYKLDEWDSGRVSDIAINLFGFYIGKAIALAFDFNIKIPYINDKNVIPTY